MSAEPTADLAPLVERARGGDRAALDALLAKVAPSVHRFALRMCRNGHDADDVLQDTLMNVAKHLGDFEGRAALSSWVFALTRSACARKRRGLKNRPPVSDDHVAEEADPSPSPETRAAGHELAAALSDALDGLPEDYREVILLRDVEGLTATETASALEITASAVKSRLHRAREALREALRPILEPTALPQQPGCPDIVARWSTNLEGDLSPRDCAAMEEHISTCASCGAACGALKQALLACQHVRGEDVPPAIQARVKEAVRAWADGTL